MSFSRIFDAGRDSDLPGCGVGDGLERYSVVEGGQKREYGLVHSAAFNQYAGDTGNYIYLRFQPP